MAVSGLLNETHSMLQYRFRQVENQWKSDGHSGSSLSKNAGGSNRSMDERIVQLEGRIAELESTVKILSDNLAKLMSGKQVEPSQKQEAKVVTKPSPKAKSAKDDDDDDIDLFGSEDDEEANELRQKRVEEYAAKKAKKPAAVAKSSVILDVKPWDDETDMEEMQRLVRSIKMDGLVWGASKYVPLAYGIKKLQIVCVIEDDKVSVDELTETIEGFSDYVQSVDIAGFNKI